MPFILYPKTRGGKIFGLAIIVFIIAVAVFSEPRDNSKTSSGSATGGEKIIVSTKCFGCTTEDNFSLASEMLQVNDEQAFAAMFSNGRCVQLGVGSVVYIENRSIFAGLVKIRPKGTTRSYWTLSASVK